MGALAKQILVKFNFHHCCNCDIPFFLPDYKEEKCLEDGSNFYCPSGHPMVFTDNEVTKLKRELQKEKQRREWAERNGENLLKARQKTERTLVATKGHVTRIKNRVGNGVCPCCNRTFQNVKRHMNCKHPDWKKK